METSNEEMHMLIKPSSVQIVDKNGKRVHMGRVSDATISEFGQSFVDMLKFLKRQAMLN